MSVVRDPDRVRTSRAGHAPGPLVPPAGRTCGGRTAGGRPRLPGAAGRGRGRDRGVQRLLLLLLLGLVASATRASAADLTLLPSPIDPDRLARMLDAAAASDDQRLAIDAAYARYAARHRELVRRRVEAADPAERSRAARATPSADTVEDERAAVRTVRSALAALAREDEVFLAEVSALLGEPGEAPVAVLAADRRAAVMTGIGRERTGHEASDLDVAALAAGLLADVDPRRAELAPVIEARLAAWRARRAPLARELGDGVLGLRTAVAERLRELGRDDFEALRDAWHGAQAGPSSAAVALGRLHRETVEGLARDLPLDLASELRSRWRRASAGALAPTADGPVLAWLEEAARTLARDEDADPRLRQRLEAERLAHVDRLHRIATRLAEAAEERDAGPAGYLTRYLVGGDDDPAEVGAAAWSDALEEAASERAAADRRGREAVLAILAATGDGALRLPEPPPAPERSAPAASVSTSITMHADGTLELAMTGLEPAELARTWGLVGAPEADVLPPPIDAATVSAWAVRLGIDEPDGPIVTAVHADYLDAWRRIRGEGAAAQARAVVRELLAPGPDGSVRVPESRRIAAALAAGERAASELAAADESLLEELGLLAPPAPTGDEAGASTLDRLRLERARARLLARVPGGTADRFSPRSMTVRPDAVSRDELAVDLAAVLAEVAVAPPERGSALDAAILEWERAVVPALESLLAAEQARRRQEIELVLAALAVGEDGRLAFDGLRLPVDDPAEDAPERRWSSAAGAVVAAGRRGREAVLAALPASDRPAFEAAWLRARHPRLHADSGRADAAFRAGLATPGLDPDRRRRLEERWADYRAAWEAVTRRLVEADGDWAMQGRLVEERDGLNRDAARAARELAGTAGTGSGTP